jgi:uncharacterized protein (TIGR04255 family)
MPKVKKVIPDPIISATIEIRYSTKSEILTTDILGKFYPLFSADFPNVKQGEIPQFIKIQNENLKFLPDYILSNDFYSIGFTTNSIIIDSIGEYNLWENFSQVIRKNLSVLSTLDIVEKIERIGMRYVSVFNEKSSLEEAFNLNLSKSVLMYKQSALKFISEYYFNQYKIIASLDKNAVFKNEIKDLEGVQVDIDITPIENVPENINENIFEIIEEMHSIQKDFIFETLLTDVYKQKLNIEYATN